jgi:hypothetical protein
MMWAAKFDNKVPDLAEQYKLLPRTNVLGVIEKLQRATSEALQYDYQWLCNAVHPSVGRILAFASAGKEHHTKTHGFEFLAPFAMHIEGFDVERTIDKALARSAVVAVAVLLDTLDAALRIIDDIALTTGAPTMASFSYS